MPTRSARCKNIGCRNWPPASGEHWPPRCWPTTPSSKSSSARCPSTGSSWARPIASSCVTVPIRDLDDAGLAQLEPRAGSFICRWPRCKPSGPISASWAATRPTPSWKPSPRPGASIAATRRWPAGSPIATRTASGSSTTCSRKRSSPPPSRFASDWAPTIGASASFSDNAGIVRFDDQYNVVLQGRNPQPSFGPRALRRRQHRHGRRDSRSRWAPAWAPSRSAIPTCSASLRPTRRPIAARQACCIRGA